MVGPGMPAPCHAAAQHRNPPAQNTATGHLHHFHLAYDTTVFRQQRATAPTPAAVRQFVQSSPTPLVCGLDRRHATANPPPPVSSYFTT